jgi:hypothetical protein
VKPGLAQREYRFWHRAGANAAGLDLSVFNRICYSKVPTEAVEKMALELGWNAVPKDMEAFGKPDEVMSILVDKTPRSWCRG